MEIGKIIRLFVIEGKNPIEIRGYIKERQVEEIRKKVSQGKTIREISDEFNVHEKTIQKMLQKYGVSTKEIVGKQILEILKENNILFFKAKRIERLTNLKVGTVRQALRYLEKEGYIERDRQDWKRIGE